MLKGAACCRGEVEDANYREKTPVKDSSTRRQGGGFVVYGSWDYSRDRAIVPYLPVSVNTYFVIPRSSKASLTGSGVAAIHRSMVSAVDSMRSLASSSFDAAFRRSEAISASCSLVSIVIE